MRRPDRPGLALVVLVALACAGALVAAAAVWTSVREDEPTREELVAERGAEVMEFDLERTTHRFEKRAGGGVQTVVADDPKDAAEIAKVRRHLRREAAAFARGRYDDPAAIHGMEMPGLAELAAGAERMQIAYAEVAAGGRIRYTTQDPRLVAALHAWFDAQVSDHGRHALEID